MNLTADRRGDERGVTPIIAVIVLFGLTVFAATLTAVAGMSMIDTVQTQSSVDHAENSMQQVKSDLDKLSSSSDVSQTGLALSGIDDGQSAVVDDGTMTFQINEGGSDECPRTGELDLGTLEYEEDGRTVGFQAGGVWRSAEGGSTMVAPPGLRYESVRRNDETVYAIDFPVTNVNPDASSAGSDSIVARQNRTLTEQRQRELQKNLCLAAGDDIDRVRNVTIRIEDNRYADAWARFLEDELMVDSVPENDVTVSSDGTVVAHAKLGGPAPSGGSGSGPDFELDSVNPRAAVHTTSTGGRLKAKNNVDIDGYNSSQATYAATADREKGKIVSATDIRVQRAHVEGDAISAGTISKRGGGTVTGAEKENQNVPPLSPIDDDVTDAIDAARASNDNNETTAIRSQELAGGSATLDDGVYYFDNFEHTSGTLTLDTSGGDVIIAVDGNVTIDGKVDVVGSGDGQVRLFATGTVDIEKHNTVTAIDDRAPKNVWYCSSSCDVTMNADKFVGLLYAPEADVTLAGGSRGGGGGGGGSPGRGHGGGGGGGPPGGTEIYGAVTGDISSVGTHTKIHYDVAIEDADVSGSVGSSGSGPGSTGSGSGGSPASSSTVDYRDAVRITSDQIELGSD